MVLYASDQVQTVAWGDLDADGFADRCGCLWHIGQSVLGHWFPGSTLPSCLEGSDRGPALSTLPHVAVRDSGWSGRLALEPPRKHIGAAG